MPKRVVKLALLLSHLDKRCRGGCKTVTNALPRARERLKIAICSAGCVGIGVFLHISIKSSLVPLKFRPEPYSDLLFEAFELVFRN